jgi:hypothetical protein
VTSYFILFYFITINVEFSIKIELQFRWYFLVLLLIRQYKTPYVSSRLLLVFNFSSRFFLFFSCNVDVCGKRGTEQGSKTLKVNYGIYKYYIQSIKISRLFAYIVIMFCRILIIFFTLVSESFDDTFRGFLYTTLIWIRNGQNMGPKAIKIWN